MIISNPEYEALLEDPDDFRPRSSLAIVVDPDPAGVRSLAAITERCAPGDRIPLHTHSVDELIIVQDGAAEIQLGDTLKKIGTGAFVFIPAGVPHALSNPGPGFLRLHGVFPSTAVGIGYLDRNPLPGTEGDPPRPPYVVDLSA